jgi:hypothetical protein
MPYTSRKLWTFWRIYVNLGVYTDMHIQYSRLTCEPGVRGGGGGEVRNVKLSRPVRSDFPSRWRCLKMSLYFDEEPVNAWDVTCAPLYGFMAWGTRLTLPSSL